MNAGIASISGYRAFRRRRATDFAHSRRRRICHRLSTLDLRSATIWRLAAGKYRNSIGRKLQKCHTPAAWIGSGRERCLRRKDQAMRCWERRSVCVQDSACLLASDCDGCGQTVTKRKSIPGSASRCRHRANAGHTARRQWTADRLPIATLAIAQGAATDVRRVRRNSFRSPRAAGLPIGGNRGRHKAPGVQDGRPWRQASRPSILPRSVQPPAVSAKVWTCALSDASRVARCSTACWPGSPTAARRSEEPAAAQAAAPVRKALRLTRDENAPPSIGSPVELFCISTFDPLPQL